jgi:hypothetical protein
MDAGVHEKATRGREGQTRLGVLSGLRKFIAVCLSACRRFLISSLLQRLGKIPIKPTLPTSINTPRRKMLVLEI